MRVLEVVVFIDISDYIPFDSGTSISTILALPTVTTAQ